MTQKIARAATGKIVERLTGATGLVVSLNELSVETAAGVQQPMLFDPSHVHTTNAGSDLAEKTAGVRYPAVNVYCERLCNDLIEKFRRFSGRVQAVIEVRLTKDRPEELSNTVELYVDAVVDVLTRNRGDWDDGMFYAGKYEVVFTPMKHGGKNFIESAKVVFDIEVSKD